jgi:hypothetical protein
MISELEKRIYNTHLVVTRKSNNLPYTLKKDFSKLPEDVQIALSKLAAFFEKHKHIDMDDFFEAPFKIHTDETYLDLDFYNSLKAVKAYSTYMKFVETDDPDSSDSLIRLQKSLKFVLDFCKSHDISLEEYSSFVEGDSTLPAYINHLKTHHINFYTIHALTFSKPDVESDILNFIFGDFWKTFQTTLNKYQCSKRMKVFGEQAKTKLKTKLTKLN